MITHFPPLSSSDPAYASFVENLAYLVRAQAERKHGTSTAQLRAMTDDELKALHRRVVTAQAAPNYVPQRLRAAPSDASKHADSILKSERARIERVARQRKLDLREKQTAADVHAAYTTSERDPFGQVEKNDPVETEFRNPDTGEIVRGIGVVERIENSNVGHIYYTRVNGVLFPLSRRSIKKIIFTKE